MFIKSFSQIKVGHAATSDNCHVCVSVCLLCKCVFVGLRARMRVCLRWVYSSKKYISGFFWQCSQYIPFEAALEFYCVRAYSSSAKQDLITRL